MREILFRGKRIDNGEWETGFFVIERFGYSDARYFITDKMTGHHTPVDPATVGQFTGLTTQDGTRVFEGDIVQTGTYGQHRAVVRYGEFLPTEVCDYLREKGGYRGDMPSVLGFYAINKTSGVQSFLPGSRLASNNVVVTGTIHDKENA